MTDEQRRELIRLLHQAEELSPEWGRVLFPPEKREYELVYHGKDREEDIIADTLAVPLQPIRILFLGHQRLTLTLWLTLLLLTLLLLTRLIGSVRTLLFLPFLPVCPFLAGYFFQYVPVQRHIFGLFSNGERPAYDVF